MPRLKITTGKQSGKTIDVSKATIIGRGETAQFQIADNSASREHCKVFEQAGAWTVADLNSRNGIVVNGIKTNRKNLSNGDEIKIGETTIVFEMASAPAAAAPAAAKRSAAKQEKEAAFAAARAGAAAPGKRPAARTAASAGDSGVKVSDHVLQFNKVDAKTAGVLDIDLAQSAGMQTALIWVACIAFLAAVVWVVVQMMG
jgi:predicted component of type VI protein secretion system